MAAFRSYTFFRVLGGVAVASVTGYTACNAFEANREHITKIVAPSVVVSCDEKNALSPKEFRKFKLEKKEALTPNTNLYRFSFPSPDMVSGITTASFLLAKAEIDGKPVIRPYTPVSLNNTKGHMDLIIKTYPEPGGLMTRHLEKLKPGDSLEMKGPMKKIEYIANMKKKIGMIAGGTGITPMLQVAREILLNPNDKTEVSLIFANVTEKDIILKSEIDSLAAKHPNFKVYYTLDKPSLGWKLGSGFVTKDMITQKIAAKEEDILILVCGPPGFMGHISGPKAPDYTQGELGGLLKELGYTSNQVFKF